VILSRDEELRVEAALEAANARTSGEIVCVLARTSRYDDGATSDASGSLPSTEPFSLWPILMALSMVFLFPAFSLVGLDPRALILPLVAALVIILARLIECMPTPNVSYDPVAASRRVAREQFRARNLDRNPSRAGVLIFVSLAEKIVHILADGGLRLVVHDKMWEGASRDLLKDVTESRIAEGLTHAIEAAGAVLADAFPEDASAGPPRSRFIVLDHAPRTTTQRDSGYSRGLGVVASAGIPEGYGSRGGDGGA